MQTNRHGSALLIVLGFLSFMVVSAVAFSIYMRSERVPSSVFRRNTQVRHLVKAALAHAMSEIDDAIRDDPYPGVVNPDSSRQMNGWNETDSLYNGNHGRYFDLWQGRVFMPPNPDYLQKNGGSLVGDPSFAANPRETVAVLNLEALGYLPPPLVNDVRLLARGSWSSKWRSFDYGAGRFAYCTVNVSDFIDINRILVGSPRDSANRENLSTFFCDTYKSEQEGVGDLGSFASFVGSRGGTDSVYPFVSMLDYSLALRGGVVGMESPFFRYIGNNNGSTMYNGNNDSAQDQLFMTDSWQPLSPRDSLFSSHMIDLNDRREDDGVGGSGQPFPRKSWMEGGKNIQDIALYSSDFFWRFMDGKTPNGRSGQGGFLTTHDKVMLYDYLDRDDCPTSLALPCTERAPMVAAMGLENFVLNGALTPTTLPATLSADGAKETTITEYRYAAQPVDPGFQLKTAVVFPFKRGQTLNQSVTAKAVVRFFLAPNGSSGLRVKGVLSNMRPRDLSDWDKSSASAFSLKGFGGDVPPYILSFVSNPVSLSIPNIEEQEDAMLGSGGTVTFSFDPLSGVNSAVVFYKKEEVSLTKNPETGVVTKGTPIVTYRFGVTPFTDKGEAWITDANGWLDQTAFAAMFGSVGFEPHVAAWVRLEMNGDTVDLAPAVFADDNLYNGINNDSLPPDFENIDGSISAGTPIFRFHGSTPTSFSSAAPESLLAFNGQVVDQPASYFAIDPRFNWAPEDWVPRNRPTTGANWIDWVTGANPDNGTDTLLDADGRDSDIFMFVSNQGFLQSMMEFAFLPHLSNFGDLGSPGAAGVPSQKLAKTFTGVERNTSANWTDAPNADCMWRTYRSFKVSGAGYEYLSRLRNFWSGASGYSAAVMNFGESGVRVNPYTDNDKILMSAFAYTPYDWWSAAGTNSTDCAVANSKDNKGARNGNFEKLANARKFTFHEAASEAPMKHDDIVNIARTIRNEIRSSSGRNWQDVYDDLNWYGDGVVQPDNDGSFRNFLGVNLDDPLYGVDRKFLHAFWRGCLANRQQLFLVFLRAESMALGGSGEGQIPPQQGARAVALVWRDPEGPCDNGGQMIGQSGQSYVNSWMPHRMRVLFFHQFD